MKRILVYGMVGTNKGGIETFLLNMNEKMSKNCVFDYVIEEKECIHEERISKKGGRVIYIESRKRNPIKNLIDNWKLLHSTKVDTIYINISSLSWIIPIIFARILGKKVYVHAHNSQFVKRNSGVIYKLAYLINKQILKILKIERLTCSKPATQFIFGRKNDVTMIFNAIDVNKYRYSTKSRKKIRDELGIGENSLVIGYVGRLVEEKNPEYLIPIATAISDNYRNKEWHLIILGDGDLKETLKSKVRSKNLEANIKIQGNVRNVEEYMSAFDCLILCSKNEGLPYVLIEAQASGINCFVSEIVTKEVCVTEAIQFVSVEKSPSEWADQILMSVPRNRIQINREVENSRFNIENEAKRLEDILCK